MEPLGAKRQAWGSPSDAAQASEPARRARRDPGSAVERTLSRQVSFAQVPLGMGTSRSRKDSNDVRRTASQVSQMSFASVGSLGEGDWLRGYMWPWLKGRCARLCANRKFRALTTILTVYALFGDDMRQAFAPKSIDDWFNAMTVICIAAFAVEIFAACVGKDDYFLGFFFLLDLAATVTLLADLTWVWDAIACGGGSSAASVSRTSRAGRAGARAARTARIIRLIRLVKLYKTYKVNLERKEREAKRLVGGVVPGEEVRVAEPEKADKEVSAADEDEDEDEEDDGVLGKDGLKRKKRSAETRVGRKLGDLTTQRVILLVLVMLFAMPMFQTTTYGFDDMNLSSDMGAELIYARIRAWCLQGLGAGAGGLPWCLTALDASANASSDARYASRAWLEQHLLAYMYHHRGGGFPWTLFWLGLGSSSLSGALGTGAAADYLAQLARLSQSRFLGPYLNQSLGGDELRFASPDWVGASIADLTDTVKWKLQQPWDETCNEYTGVSLTDDASGGRRTCLISKTLRCSEVTYTVPLTKSDEESGFLSIMFAFDTRGISQLDAGLSLCQTVFICLIVGLGALSFSNDAERLLLRPIARMVRKMETIKDDPLMAMKLGDIEFRREEMEQQRRKEELEKMGKCCRLVTLVCQSSKPKEPMETLVLEKTIIKLGGLLALGFGEAGVEIIGHNMRGSSTAGVDAMVPGAKVDAIIGFCNIRNFTDATEVLKEKVMVFVNQIGEIVHGCVDDNHGAPNKNIGDCFLLVWRLSEVPTERRAKLADMAVMSFIRIVAEINKSRVLAVYRDHPGLKQRLRTYRVEMGFGLHCGWAIEGAIGSEFKIDASYLSPNVNVASRFQAATEQFGVWLLMSHFMVKLCSREMASYCRLIDHVTVKGSKQPVRLYTIDLDFLRLKVQPKTMDKLTKNRYKIRQMREVRKAEKWSDEYSVWESFLTDPDLVTMRLRYSTEFFQRFAMGFKNYEAGQWMVARDMLCTCHYSAPEGISEDLRSARAAREDEWPEDGPTTTLLLFMKRSHFYPPNDWRGYRELTQK